MNQPKFLVIDNEVFAVRYLTRVTWPSKSEDTMIAVLDADCLGGQFGDEWPVEYRDGEWVAAK